MTHSVLGQFLEFGTLDRLYIAWIGQDVKKTRSQEVKKSWSQEVKKSRSQGLTDVELVC